VRQAEEQQLNFGFVGFTSHLCKGQLGIYLCHTGEEQAVQMAHLNPFFLRLAISRGESAIEQMRYIGFRERALRAKALQYDPVLLNPIAHASSFDDACPVQYPTLQSLVTPGMTDTWCVATNKDAIEMLGVASGKHYDGKLINTPNDPWSCSHMHDIYLTCGSPSPTEPAAVAKPPKMLPTHGEVASPCVGIQCAVSMVMSGLSGFGLDQLFALAFGLIGELTSAAADGFGLSTEFLADLTASGD